MNELLQAIKKTLQDTKLFKSVEIHGGGFSGIEDLKKFAQVAPASRVGLVNMGEILATPEGMLECALNLSIIFSSADINPQKTRHTEALRILEEVLLLVKDGRWGSIKNPVADTEIDSIKTTNYYGSQLYGNNLALWKVDWVQRLKLGTDRFNLTNKA
ncbi:putative phage protein [Candidatus Hepatincola sp. Av]